MIVVRALGVARSYMKEEREVDAPDGLTVEEFMKLLPDGLRGLAARNEVVLLINGSDASARDGPETRLRDGDEVVILPFAHGG